MPGRNVSCNPGAHTGNVPWALVMTVVLMRVTLRATIHGALGRTQRAPRLALMWQLGGGRGTGLCYDWAVAQWESTGKTPRAPGYMPSFC